MRNKDWELSSRKYTAWQKEGKMYNPPLNMTLPAASNLSHDFPVSSGTRDPVPKVDDHLGIKGTTSKWLTMCQTLFQSSALGPTIRATLQMRKLSHKGRRSFPRASRAYGL